MKLKMKAREWVARLRSKVVVALPFVRKIASFFAPGLTKLGEILVVSGAASIGFSGAEGSLGIMSIDFKGVDFWLAAAVVVTGLVIWALAVFLKGRRCDKNRKDE